MGDSLVDSSGCVLPRIDADARQEWVRVQYETFGPGLRRYLTRRLGDASAAEDLVQETFLRLFEELRHGRRIGSLRSWLFQVGHNLAVDRLRRQGLEHWAVEAACEAEAKHHPPDAESNLLIQERRLQVRRGLALLTPQERQCLELRAEGLRYREIAEIMGLHISTVTTFTVRAVKKIARQLHA